MANIHFIFKSVFCDIFIQTLKIPIMICSKNITPVFTHDSNLSRGATLNSGFSKNIRYALPDVGFLPYHHNVILKTDSIHQKRFEKGSLNHTNCYFRLFFVKAILSYLNICMLAVMLIVRLSEIVAKFRF